MGTTDREPLLPPDPFELANRIFSEALDLPESERAAFVRASSETGEIYTDVMQMLSRFQDMGDFMAEPVIGPDRTDSLPADRGEIAPGAVLNQRFRVIELIGRGGMGEVYKALDELSGETVAIKTLRASFLGDSGAAERFRQELTLARRVAHHNVCRIYELFAEPSLAGPILYFSMECLEGETLAERLRRGPIAPAEALSILRQIAAGLDAAHSAGILHRDLKPSNVFLASPRPGTDLRGDGSRVAITDFGLAKALTAIRASEGPTLTGQTPGTPAYMAPEQFLGEPLTERTDVFALGLIAFEMLAGRHPFPREDVGSSLRKTAVPVSPLWTRAIDRALNPMPEKRYSSAGAFIRDLNRAPGPRLPISRRALISTGAGISLAAAAASLRFFDWGVRLPASPVLMLTPLTHSSDALTAGTLDLLIAAQLTQSAHFTLLSKDQAASAWQRITGAGTALPERLEPAAARDIALRGGADFVLFGNLGRIGDDYVLRLNLELMGSSPAHARHTWSHDFTASGRSDLPSVAFDGASWIRATAGESEQELRARSRRPEEMTTSSWQALEEFTQADQAWVRQNFTAALLHLQTAIDLDPGFALAEARMGDILTALNRSDEGLPYYQSATNLIRTKNLTDRESLRIRGIFLLDTWQNEEAGRVFERWALEYPRDPMPLFYRATVLDHAGRFDEALGLGRLALALDPNRAVFIEALAERLLNMGRLTEASAEASRFAAIDPAGWSQILMSSLSLAGMNLRGAWTPLERLRRADVPRFRSLGYSFQACFRAEQKRWADAEDLCRTALEWDLAHGLVSEQFVHQRQLAQILLRQNRKREAIALCQRILASKPSERQIAEVGCLLAQAGDPDRARGCLRPGLPLLPTYLSWKNRLLGEIAVARGDAANGLALMKQATPQSVGVWREEILEAALAAGDRDAAVSSLGELFSNPGRAWRTAWFVGPGFLVRAAEISQAFSLPAQHRKTAEQLRRMFSASMEL